jgi:hypothetical protein
MGDGDKKLPPEIPLEQFQRALADVDQFKAAEAMNVPVEVIARWKSGRFDNIADARRAIAAAKKIREGSTFGWTSPVTANQAFGVQD